MPSVSDWKIPSATQCQRFDLRRIPAALITKHLAHIAQLENISIEAPALYAIARGAEGAMRDAESTLDQLISFCGDKIGEADVLSMFGLVAQSQLLELARAVLEGAVDSALRQLNNLANNGKDLGRLVADLLNHFRNLLIFQVSRGNTAMLEVSEEEAGALAAQAKLASADGLTRILEVLADAEMRLRDAASKKILIEVALLRAIEARSTMNLDAVLEQLRALREKVEGDVVTLPVPAPAPTPDLKPFRSEAVAREPAVAQTVTPFSAAEGASAGMAAGEIREQAESVSARSSGMEGLWAKLIEAIGRVSLFTRSYLIEAHPVSFKDNVLTIGFAPEFEDHIGLVDNAKNHTLLQTKLAELGHPKAMVKFIKAEPPTDRAKFSAAPAEADAGLKPAVAAADPVKRPLPAGPPAKEKLSSVPFRQDDFKNDPLIQKALEIFKGQIIEVRA